VKTLFNFLLISGLALAQGPSLDTKQRTKAVRDLAKQGQDAIPKIAPYVSDPDVSVRVEAVKALVEIGGPKTVDGLVKAAGDNDAEIQIRATDGLVNVYLPGYTKVGMSGTIQRVGNTIKARFGDTNDQVIDTFVQAKSDILALIWGPIKLLLQISKNLTQSFDAIVNTMANIGEKLRLEFVELC